MHLWGVSAQQVGNGSFVTFSSAPAGRESVTFARPHWGQGTPNHLFGVRMQRWLRRSHLHLVDNPHVRPQW
jgi:hypothetical protein